MVQNNSSLKEISPFSKNEHSFTLKATVPVAEIFTKVLVYLSSDAVFSKLGSRYKAHWGGGDHAYLRRTWWEDKQTLLAREHVLEGMQRGCFVWLSAVGNLFIFKDNPGIAHKYNKFFICGSRLFLSSRLHFFIFKICTPEFFFFKRAGMGFEVEGEQDCRRRSSWIQNSKQK